MLVVEAAAVVPEVLEVTVALDLQAQPDHIKTMADRVVMAALED
jgi:hypothetical protein